MQSKSRKLDILLFSGELPDRAIASWLHLSPNAVKLYRVQLVSCITFRAISAYLRRLSAL